ncbi:hypothetical protein BC830DRAFT_1155635 [Chytriomyces sp. MP71]|nr:hypothetical protein BC830DRAFT_1155635 [Chytriomyces sp. MP71]
MLVTTRSLQSKTETWRFRSIQFFSCTTALCRYFSQWRRALHSTLAAKQSASPAGDESSNIVKRLQSIMHDLPSLEAVFTTSGGQRLLIIWQQSFNYQHSRPAASWTPQIYKNKSHPISLKFSAGDMFVGYFGSNLVAKSGEQESEKNNAHFEFVSG